MGAVRGHVASWWSNGWMELPMGQYRRRRRGTGSLPRGLGKTSRSDLSASPGGESEEGMGERQSERQRENMSKALKT